MSGFTHFNEDGNAVMVDVGAKAETKREALASGVIRMSEECFQKVKEGSMKKGDVLGVARIAGIMGAKKTAELIPLCARAPAPCRACPDRRARPHSLRPRTRRS